MRAHRSLVKFFFFRLYSCVFVRIEVFARFFRLRAEGFMEYGHWQFIGYLRASSSFSVLVSTVADMTS